VIRPARADDAAALLEIDRATWSWDVSPAPLGTPTFRPEETLVAEVDGAVAGYVALGAATPLESNRHVAYVRGFAIAPAQQRTSMPC
jgi:acetyltransferase (GNAT) family protein